MDLNLVLYWRELFQLDASVGQDNHPVLASYHLGLGGGGGGCHLADRLGVCQKKKKNS